MTTQPDEQRRHILLVDDEPNIRRLLGSVLKKSDEYEVTLAEDGQDALDKLAAIDYAVDLVITDMQMPRLNGEALIRTLRQSHPHLPCLVLTAHKNDRNVLECLKLGTVEYLTKPIGVDHFLQTIGHVLERHKRFQGQQDAFEVRQEVKGWVEITAPTDYEYVERFQKFTSLLGSLPLSEEAQGDIRVAIDELGQNAVEWGNRNDRGKRIHLSYCLFKDRIVFKIEDEGEGFDPDSLRDPSVDPLAHIMARMQEGKRAGGYGVFITGKLMDDVIYNERGNTVLMTKNFQTSAE